MGRGPEMVHLERVWRQGRRRLRVVAITGEAGIGKTRLVAEFLSRAQAGGARVLQASCEEFLDEARAPMLEMLRSDLAGRDVEALVRDLGDAGVQLARLLPEWTACALPPDRPAEVVPTVVDPARVRLQQLEGMVGWLRAATSADDLCLFIDDVHWADAETVAVLEHLVEHHTDLPLLLLVTSREHGSDAAEQLLAGVLRASETVVRLPLGGLGDDEVRRLVGAELASLEDEGQPDAEEFMGRVCDVAGGNPLFVRELARSRAGSTSSDPVAGADVGLVVGEMMPSHVHQVIRSRAARLPESVRECLRAAAVVGRVFEPGLVAGVTGLYPAEVDRALASAAEAALVEEHSAAPLRFRFCHEAVRIALYDDVGPLQRSDLHHRVGQLVEERSVDADSEVHHLALGHHYGRAADPTLERRAAGHLRRAAELAAERGGHAAAVRLLARVEGLLGDSAAAAERCDLAITRGVAEFYAGLPGFRDTLLGAAREAARAGLHEHLVRAVVANHRGWYSSTTSVDDERVELIRLALLRCPDDDLRALARLNAMWAMEKVREPQERGRVLERSLASVLLAERLGDPDLLIDILCDRFSVLYASFEDPVGVAGLARRIEDLAERSGGESHVLNAAIAVAQSTMMIGDFATSDEALELSEALAARIHRPVRLWLARVWTATRVAMRGDLARAEELAGEALEFGVTLNQPDAFTWYAGQLFCLRNLADRLEEIVEAIEEQVNAHAATVPAWRAGLALALAKVGRTGEARSIVDELVAREGAGIPQDMIRLPGLAFLACAVAELGDVGAARVVHDELLPYTGMFAHNGTIDAGPIDLHLGALAVTFGDSDRASRYLAAASGQCDRAGAEAWITHVDRWLGVAVPAQARISVLGTFGVVGVGGQEPVRWTSRKARTLLKFLVASHGSVVRRETILHLLWPDTDPDLLANRFAVALATVRRALDPDRARPTEHHVELRDDLVRLRVEHLDVDLDQFHALAVCEHREGLRRAVDLYLGDPFMDEPDAEWAVDVRAHAQVSWRQALTRLAGLEAERGDLVTAAGLFRKVLEVDPYAENAARGLADVLTQMGIRGQATTVLTDLDL
ncbi:AAA family ATPase [Nocardioides sp. Bht2]|uniref:AAA family ATPase n=1 Tax=Nocardioides sp. Bht2 TaxID=3392297 RepID=UPI0039B6CFF2